MVCLQVGASTIVTVEGTAYVKFSSFVNADIDRNCQL